MFTLLRGIVIVGLIFYFSPARQASQPQSQVAEAKAKPDSTDDRRAQDASNAREGGLNMLVSSLKEEVMRTAVSEKTLSAGLGLGSAAGSLEAPAKIAATEARFSTPSSWSLRPSHDPSVRCVYRCDGSE